MTDLTPAPARSRMAVPDTALLALLGSRDESLRAAEDLLDADVHVRGNELTLSGAPAEVAFAERVFGELISLAQRGQHVGTDTVRRTVEMLSDSSNVTRIGESPAEVLSLDILSRRGKTIRPKTLNQKRYVDAIDENTIVFGIGPAGTGKTYLAMAKAVQALQAKQVSRIILTRPAVEAGERLGFLPGTLIREDRPVPAAALRRAARHDRPGVHPEADGSGHHRGRAPGVHARPGAAGRHAGADAGGFRPIGELRVGDLVVGSTVSPRRCWACTRRARRTSSGSRPRTARRRSAAASTSGSCARVDDKRRGKPGGSSQTQDMIGNLRAAHGAGTSCPLLSAAGAVRRVAACRWTRTRSGCSSATAA